MKWGSFVVSADTDEDDDEEGESDVSKINSSSDL
jgi:hypothetical protein